jgi:GT2 family glycosyltransferase
VIKTSSKNPGVQRNLGAQNTKSPLLIFLDADCIPGDKWLEEIFAVMDECSPHGIQGVDFSLTSGKVEQALSRGHRQYLDNGLVQGRMSLVDTRNLCLLRNAFDSVGGFDEKLPSLEDRDLGRRLYNAGFNIILSERVIVYHRWDKGNFYTFFRWGMWYGEGEFIFVLKWQGLNKKGMALDIIISTYKRIRMSLGKWLREPSETNFLFLIKEMGISTGKLSAFLLHILNT